MFDPDGVISTNMQQEAYNSSLTACKIKKFSWLSQKSRAFWLICGHNPGSQRNPHVTLSYINKSQYKCSTPMGSWKPTQYKSNGCSTPMGSYLQIGFKTKRITQVWIIIKFSPITRKNWWFWLICHHNLASWNIQLETLHLNTKQTLTN